MATNQRVDIKRVLKAINDGAYDDLLDQIETEIANRRTIIREELEAKVKEMLGDDWRITHKSAPQGIYQNKLTPNQNTIATNDKEMTGFAPIEPDDGFDESNSPIIGSI